MDAYQLAHELIELRCGSHSLGNIYEFLLRAYGDENKAKADFTRFLSGELSERILEVAADWISEEQEPQRFSKTYNGQTALLTPVPLCESTLGL